ncbi:hypothetical protein CVT25_014642 [Psilocybe cyanescens]|uniref:Histone deacetylase interacting domain-containing protein n=1 Tax=Psilocybe cyanescens TaxID=93625 RepID=A0A409WU55_PSICY|nr:hypothetical protein CVT25_014642 [Psilocybe cyanescens]
MPWEHCCTVLILILMSPHRTARSYKAPRTKTLQRPQRKQGASITSSNLALHLDLLEGRLTDTLKLAPVGLQQSTETGRLLTVNDALSYLDAIRSHYHDAPEVYQAFLDIMKDFKNHVIDTPGVIQRVTSLFNGHPDLLEGLNVFLPVGYHIRVTRNLDPDNCAIGSLGYDRGSSVSTDYSIASSRTQSTDYGLYYTRMALSEDPEADIMVKFELDLDS